MLKGLKGPITKDFAGVFMNDFLIYADILEVYIYDFYTLIDTFHENILR
jgi:hypothetical protein